MKNVINPNDFDDNSSQPPGNNFPLYGTLPEVISPYLRDLIKSTGGIKGPIGLQFVSQPQKEKKNISFDNFDPLFESHHEVVPGLIYKYHGQINSRGEVVKYGRVLWTITYFCGSYCRFCTRGREVGTPCGYSKNNIHKVIEYISQHSEINEVILSGGDPLTTPQKYFTEIIKQLSLLQKKNKLDIIRIGTRLPIVNPLAVQNWHYELIKNIKNPYLMVHVNHESELTPTSLAVLNKFRQSGAIVMSQTVLLKGVNDSVSVLSSLFNKMVKEGIRPYYLYQNDPVPWAKHFTVPIHRAIKLWEKLRPRLSGLSATARFVIDTPFGYGKIPFPEGKSWKVDYHFFRDFKNHCHQL